VATYADELESTGSLSMGVFQTLSVGKMGQPAMVGASWAMANPVKKMAVNMVTAPRQIKKDFMTPPLQAVRLLTEGFSCKSNTKRI